MRIGPLTIERTKPPAQSAAPTKTPSPQFGEIGAPGTQIFGGTLMQQDYNPDLQAPASYDIYDKMRFSDGQVGAALKVIKLPILRAHWEVEPASDSAQDREIAEFCERDLRNMTTSFAATLRQIMLHLDYGSHPFEEVWEVRDDGLVHLRKLAPRHPRSVLRWLSDENGGFAGIQQGAIKASGWSLVDIPGSKLVNFVNEQEGANFRGISILRQAYKHWFYKDGMYRIDAIANEKRTVSIDIGTIKPGAVNKDSVKESLERALMTFHAHEKNYFVEDEENYTYRLETGGVSRGNANAIMASIDHHDLRILRAVIAEFVAMGSGSTGSLAMHKDKTGFFLMALEATSDNIAETITAYLLKRWVDYNWRVTEYPRMKYSRLDTRDTAQLAQAVNQLMSVKALTAGEDTERELRVLLDLPEETRPYEDEPEEPEIDDDEAQIRELKAAAKALGFRLRKAVA
jgi:phage gp29-like protein